MLHVLILGLCGHIITFTKVPAVSKNNMLFKIPLAKCLKGFKHMTGLVCTYNNLETQDALVSLKKI